MKGTLWLTESPSSVAITPLVQQSVGPMRYYDLTKNWRKVKPHLADENLNRIMKRDFEKFVRGRWGKEFLPGQFPGDFGLWWRRGMTGRPPQWWRYVSPGACHWLVNTGLKMAVLVEPERPWRVITSDKHSTVWDGRETLFEFNFQAFGISADECFAFATEAEANPRELRPGKERKAGSPEHYSVERNNVYRRAANNSGMLNLVPANDNDPLIAVAA